ncbi:MAG TPA: efflux RND transporter periplasmic adaptor subunit [Treponemataceae bacterium]|nr:efflux RND transporter periplasmic adaptor subunit [Treponemataceae bacterium]
MKKKTKYVVLAVVLLIAAGGTVFLMTASSRRKKAPLQADLAPVSRGILEDRVSAAGSFQAETWTTVASRTVGIVRSVSVRPGDRVSEDDIIVVVDEKDARENLDSAKIALDETGRALAIELSTLRAEVRRAALAAEQAGRAAASAEKLHAIEGVSEEEWRKATEQEVSSQLALSDARDRLRMAQGLDSGSEPSLDPSTDRSFIESSPAYRRALLALESARRVLEGCVIRAESAGIVTEVGVAVGDRLTLETKIATIEDPSSMTADVQVDEVDIGKINEGMAAEVTADSMFGKTLKGTVRRIWPIVRNDGNGRVCRVRISLDPDQISESADSAQSAAGSVLSGASCMARISSVLREETLTIPSSALIPGAKPAAVWVAVRQAVEAEHTDGRNAPGEPDASPGLYTLERREIGTGASTVSRIEVVSGLAEGELVVSDRLQEMSDGLVVSGGSLL